ncbi:unnamed protein product [Arabidopsis arenosa]|uniref:NADH:quinone oxidoreductase/Mrp antiporter transmembrane domain-containing protein n=1 Tax=Arabidopsis arenosa TaxID=38785 RepID=A0A8S2A779_ARAAE|nr:unnamed protein product [Arabidopsis arenosa]
MNCRVDRSDPDAAVAPRRYGLDPLLPTPGHHSMSGRRGDILDVWERSWSGKAKTAPRIWVARGRLCPDGGALWGRAQPNRDSTPPASSAPLYRLNHSFGLVGGTGEPRELACLDIRFPPEDQVGEPCDGKPSRTADKAATKAMLVNRVGATTSFLAATTGILQNDLKRVIAYSTCSQLGYMIFACGISNYSVSVFHLMNHAFFKALLFLSAGSVIHAMSDEQDMRKMGGLASSFPLTYAMMLIGSLSLIGFPFLTGFYSKDVILELAYTKYTISGNFAFWLGSISVLFTSYYSFRLLFLTFLVPTNSFGRDISRCHDAPIPMAIPSILLALGSLFVGYLAKALKRRTGTSGINVFNFLALHLPSNGPWTKRPLPETTMSRGPPPPPTRYISRLWAAITIQEDTRNWKDKQTHPVDCRATSSTTQERDSLKSQGRGWPRGPTWRLGISAGNAKVATSRPADRRKRIN